MSLHDHYHDSYHMARVLASYLDCPFRIQREVQTMFHQGPTLDTIRKLRAAHLAERASASEVPAFKPHDGYYPDDAADYAARANFKFLEALNAARAA